MKICRVFLFMLWSPAGRKTDELKEEFCVYHLKGTINLTCHTVNVKYFTKTDRT